MQTAEIFMSGMATMGFFVGGLFFFRFWSRTRERLFAIFGVAFCLLAINQMLSPAAVFGPPSEELAYVYLLGIVGYLMLIAGIVAKNLEERKPRQA
jgi:hypothetical protein